MEPLRALVAAEFMFYGQTANKWQIEQFALELSRFALDEVRQAYQALRMNSERMPFPSKVVEQILGFPTAEDAWTWMPKTEADHACFNQASSVAFAQVREALNDGDHLGAKLAFKSIYESEVARLKASKTKCVHRIDVGFRKDDRADFAAKCVARGLIPATHAIEFNPSQALPFNAPLIESSKELYTESVALENLEKLKGILDGIQKRKFRKGMKVKYGQHEGIINNVVKGQIEAEFKYNERAFVAFFNFSGELLPLKDHIINPRLEIL